MNQIETDNNEECNFYIPSGSPFSNLRPMTPIDVLIQNLYHTLDNLSNERIYEIQQYTFNRLNNFNQYTDYDADHVDEHHKDNFKSISISKENSDIEVKENINEEVKDDEKEVNDDDEEEISNANSSSDSDSETEAETESIPNIESNNKTETMDVSNIKIIDEKKVDIKNKIDSHVKVESNSDLIIGKITTLKDKKAIITLPDNRIGYFPDKFDYYGKLDDKVRVSIKFENKQKNLLILNFINTQYTKDDVVIGTISISKDITYVFTPAIKKATFPKNFSHTGLKNGMKVSCSIFNTYDYKDADNNVIGMGAILSFISIIS
jgi:hypothetical protein